jgi:hypothetical protein
VLVDGVGGAIGTAAASLVAKGGRVVRIGYSSGSFGADSDMFAAAGVEERWVVGPKAAPLTVPVREFETRALDATANGVWAPFITEYAHRRCRARSPGSRRTTDDGQAQLKSRKLLRVDAAVDAPRVGSACPVSRGAPAEQSFQKAR